MSPISIFVRENNVHVLDDVVASSRGSGGSGLVGLWFDVPGEARVGQLPDPLGLLGLDFATLVVELVVETLACFNDLLELLTMLVKASLFRFVLVLRFLLLLLQRGQLFSQLCHVLLLLLLLDVELSKLILAAFFDFSLSGLVLGIHLGLFLGDLDQPLVLVLQLGLEIGHLLHLGVPGRPHAVDKQLDVGDASPRLGDLVGHFLDLVSLQQQQKRLLAKAIS